MRHDIRLFGVAAILLCCFHETTRLSGAEPAKPTSVDSVAAEDLLVRVKIIGLLERPLGDIVQVKGVWIASDPSKPGEIRFRVNDVGGKPTKMPVEFLRSQVEGNGIDETTRPAIGEQWEMRVLETGGIVGLPAAAFKHPVQQPYGYCFLTRLYVLSLDRK